MAAERQYPALSAPRQFYAGIRQLFLSTVNTSNVVQNINGKLVGGAVAEIKPEDVPQAAPGVTPERKATGVAKSFDKALAGTYAVTAGSGLHIRNVAGSKTGSMIVLPHGTKVRNYGYYTQVDGVKWLYIQVTYQGVKYTGFSSGEFLKKQ